MRCEIGAPLEPLRGRYRKQIRDRVRDLSDEMALGLDPTAGEARLTALRACYEALAAENCPAKMRAHLKHTMGR